MLSDSWICKTNQLWKLCVFVFLLAIDAILFIQLISVVNGISVIRAVGTDQVILTLLIVTVGNVTFWWFFLIFRCRGCGFNVGKFVLLKSNTSEWLNNLLGLRSCPRCGNTGHH